MSERGLSPGRGRTREAGAPEGHAPELRVRALLAGALRLALGEDLAAKTRRECRREVSGAACNDARSHARPAAQCARRHVKYTAMIPLTKSRGCCEGRSWSRLCLHEADARASLVCREPEERAGPDAHLLRGRREGQEEARGPRGAEASRLQKGMCHTKVLT